MASAGFNRADAADFVAARRPEQGKLDLRRGRVEFKQVIVKVSENLETKGFSRGLKAKVKFSKSAGTLEIKEPLSSSEEEELTGAATMDDTNEKIRGAVAMSRDSLEVFQTPSERGLDFRVPQMEVMIAGELRVFDEPEALDYPWELPAYHATPTSEQLAALGKGGENFGEAGRIDIDDEAGRVRTELGRELERDLALSYVPEHWTEAKLAAWFCRQIHDASITHASKRAFVAGWLGGLLAREGFDLAMVNRRKFFIRNLIARQVDDLRKDAVRRECQTFLFGEEKETRVRVGTEYLFEFHPDAYSPVKLYDGRFGDHDFQKHYYPKMGDFDSKEEFACACWLDARKEVSFWVRNLVRRNGMSFFLQKADGRFYPDFICKLTDGRILAVEYKGEVYWSAAEDDRLIGGLWEEMSGGACAFVMVKDKNWAAISAKIG